MTSHTSLHSALEPSLALVPRSNSQIRRIFNNDQIIEKFDNWLLICGKSKNTRDSYVLAVKQLGKFIINKPLTAITKEDVLAFLGNRTESLYGQQPSKNLLGDQWPLPMKKLRSLLQKNIAQLYKIFLMVWVDNVQP
jgi:hypothetical protein